MFTKLLHVSIVQNWLAGGRAMMLVPTMYSDRAIFMIRAYYISKDAVQDTSVLTLYYYDFPVSSECSDR